MGNFITKRFVQLTYNQSGSTLFADGNSYINTRTAYKLVGQTADEAELVAYTGNSANYDQISKDSVVFVDFPDGTTGIITHLKFYSRLSDLQASGSTGIKVFKYNGGSGGHGRSVDDRLPSESSEDLGFQRWDVVAFVNTYTGVLNNFDLAVCTDAYPDSDGSGNVTYRYTWVPVYSWNETDWAAAQSSMNS